MNGDIQQKKMLLRFQIERAVVIAFFGVAYAREMAQFIPLGRSGIPLVIVASAIFLTFGCGFLMRSSKLAFAFAVMTIFSFFAAPVAFVFDRSHQRGGSPTMLVISEAVTLLLAICLFDLWSEWRGLHKAGSTGQTVPSPVTTPITPPTGTAGL